MKKILILTLLVSWLASCTVEPRPLSVEQQDKITVNQTQERLSKAVSLPKLTNSIERANIKKRLETFEDENKVSYIYFTSYGRIMAYYTVKGKVSSGNKRLTTTQKLQKNANYKEYWYSVMEAPWLDGTYGSSDSYIFFWTTDWIYVQWNWEYMMSDRPLKLSETPLLIKNL